MPPLSWTVSFEAASVISNDAALTLFALSALHTGFNQPFDSTVPEFNERKSIFLFL
jgi:hypothetical protein